MHLEFYKLEEKVKETVVDQFVRHTSQLKELLISAPATMKSSDLVNVADLAAVILEAQEEIHMEKLCLSGLNRKVVREPLAEERRLINAVVNSGISELLSLDLSSNVQWFAQNESTSYLLDFIKQQTCLKTLLLDWNEISCAVKS